MAIDRPKILTRITVPSGGWGLQFQFSVASQYDNDVTATVAAGDYYVSWDSQADDLLWALGQAMMTAIEGAIGSGNTVRPNVWIDSNNKVRIQIFGSGHARLEWTHVNSDADLASAIGFDSSADDADTAGPTTGTDKEFTGDWQHSHGWYASEDGSLATLFPNDSATAIGLQSVSYAGLIASRNISTHYGNKLGLDYLSEALTFSRGALYGEAPVYPAQRNVPLECWWRAAQSGVEFRVYNDGRNGYDPEGKLYGGVLSAASTGDVTDSTKSWDTDPRELVGALYVAQYGYTSGSDSPARAYIVNNTATVLSFTDVPQWSDLLGNDWSIATNPYTVVDQRYRTYVLNVDRSSNFEPSELPGIHRFSVEFTLRRYI